MSRPRNLAKAAAEILEYLYSEKLAVPKGGRGYQPASLAVLSLKAELIDGFLAHELGRPATSACKKIWRAKQRELSRSLSKGAAKDVGLVAKSLKRDFRSSLTHSALAARLAEDLSAICLAIVIHYPGHHTAGPGFDEAVAALNTLVVAMSRRAA